MSGRARRGAAGLAVALVAAFVVAGGSGSPARAAPTPSSTSPSTGSSTRSSTGAPAGLPAIVALTSVQKDSASPLTVAGLITLARTASSAATDLTVSLGLGAPVTNRGELIDDRSHPEDAISATRLAQMTLPSIAVGGRQRFQLPAVPLTDRLSRSALQVYPVTVTVRGTLAGAAGTVLARTVTFVVSAPGGAVSARTGVAVVLPLADRPHLAATGTSLLDNDLATQIAPGGRLARLLRQVAPSHGVAPAVSLAVDPETARAIKVMADGPYRVTRAGRTVVHPQDPSAVAFLRDLRAFAVAKGSVLALPYGDPDVVALTRARQYYQIVAAILRGSEVLGGAMGGDIRPTGTVALPPGGLADEATLDILRRAVPGNGGVRTVLLSGTALPPAAGETATPPAAVPVEAGKGTLRAVVADADLAAVAAGDGGRSDAEARQDYLAGTAMITREEPATPRDQLIVLPRQWNPTPGLLRTVFSNLTTPWSAAVPLQRVAAAAGPAAARAPLTYPAAARAAELAPGPLAATAVLRNQVVALHAVLCPTTGTAAAGAAAAPSSGSAPATARTGSATGSPAAAGGANPTTSPVPVTAASELSCSKQGSIASMMDALVASESASFRGNAAGATALRGQVSDELTALRDGIRLVASQKVTLTSRKGRVPVTLENDLSQSVSVQLALSTPDKARLGSASVVLRTIGPKQKVQVDIQVHAESAGSFPVYISLLTPQGESFKPGPPSLVLVRSTAYGIIATAITVCALGVLALAVVVRSVRRVRTVRAARRENPTRAGDGPTDVPGIRPTVGGNDRPTGGQW